VARFVVDGLTLPIAIGNHPAVDLCNTQTDWNGAVPREYLVSYTHLAVWSREIGLVDTGGVATALAEASRRSGDADAVLARALAFRGALHRVLIGLAVPTDWSTINAELAANVSALRLTALDEARPSDGDRATPTGAWSLHPTDSLDAPLAAAVWAAAGLLTTAAPGEVRPCPGTGCGWMFLDPAGRRRWCSMAWCGNRAKARRHALRQRLDSSAAR
jgi:predicted RNA-binding Zn ribbon-like protein